MEFEFEFVEVEPEIIEPVLEPKLFKLFNTKPSNIKLGNELAPQVQRKLETTEEDEEEFRLKVQSIVVDINAIKREAETYFKIPGKLIVADPKNSRFPKRKSRLCRRNIRNNVVLEKQYYPKKPIRFIENGGTKIIFSDKSRKRRRPTKKPNA
jgi:hypothetical protein